MIQLHSERNRDAGIPGDEYLVALGMLRIVLDNELCPIPAGRRAAMDSLPGSFPVDRITAANLLCAVRERIHATHDFAAKSSLSDVASAGDVRELRAKMEIGVMGRSLTRKRHNGCDAAGDGKYLRNQRFGGVC